MGSVTAVFCYGLLTQGCPSAARVVGIAILGIFCVVTVWRLVSLLRSKREAAPVGLLSPDEKQKARSKLLKPGSRIPLPN
jgi:hypothetical protein